MAEHAPDFIAPPWNRVCVESCFHILTFHRQHPPPGRKSHLIVTEPTPKEALICKARQLRKCEFDLCLSSPRKHAPSMTWFPGGGLLWMLLAGSLVCALEHAACAATSPQLQGYYMTFMRMPVMDLADWK